MPTAANLHYFASDSQNFDQAPVLLIHGAGGNHLHWPPQIRRISSHRVFAMDLPGHGQSDGLGRDHIEDYFDDVVAFMGAVGLNAAVWVGHSMGGAIALHAALRQPRRVLGLILVASGARLRVDSELLNRSSRATTFPAALNWIGERAFSDSSDSRLRQLAMQRMGEIRPTVLHGDLLACNAFDATASLPEVRVPTLVVSGTHDRMMPPRSAEFLQSAIHGSKLLMIRDAGHMVMLEKPEEAAGACTRFLETIAYKAGVFPP